MFSTFLQGCKVSFREVLTFYHQGHRSFCYLLDQPQTAKSDLEAPSVFFNLRPPHLVITHPKYKVTALFDSKQFVKQIQIKYCFFSLQMYSYTCRRHRTLVFQQRKISYFNVTYILLLVLLFAFYFLVLYT